MSFVYFEFTNTFNVSIQAMAVMTDERCHYCERLRGALVLGIDRIDSNGSYAPGNVVGCCTRCNVMKSDSTQASFMSHMRKRNVPKTVGERLEWLKAKFTAIKAKFIAKA